MRRCRKYLVALLGAVALAAACSDKHAEPRKEVRGGIAREVTTGNGNGTRYAPAAAPMPGALDYLSAFAGRTPGESGLWNTRPLHERLAAMLGGNYERVVTLLPDDRLAVDGGVYYVASRSEHGVIAVVMDPHADSIYVVEQDGSGRHEYLERSHKPELPPAVRALLASLPLR